MKMLMSEGQVADVSPSRLDQGDHYEFPCGCKFAVAEGHPDVHGRKALHYDLENVPLDCEATWDLFATGRTKGVFQLESPLGKQWSKKLKPRNIEHLSALVALLRPGVLRAKDERGMSMTELYCLRKNGVEETVIDIEATRSILEPTYGILCIHEDTRIGMEDGTERPISLVRAGDRVNTLDGYNLTNGDCHGCGPTRRCDGVKITLSNCYSVVLTEDHEVYTIDGLKRAGDLIPDVDAVAVPTNISSKPTASQIATWLGADEDVAYLLGYITGNGCKGCTVTVATGPESRADILMDWARSAMPSLATRKYHNTRSWYVVFSHAELANDPDRGNRTKRFNLFVDRMGLSGLSVHKRIPEVIFRSPASVRRAYMAGLFDADGGDTLDKKGRQYCTFCSSSPGLIQDVRRLASLDGIIAAIRTDGRHIGFVNVERFKETVGKHLKIRSLDGIITDGDGYGVVRTSAIRQAWEASGLSQDAFCKRYDIARVTLRVDYYPFSTHRTGKRVGVDTGDVRYIAVRSVEKVQDQQFYGMSVAHTHNLVANGIVVRNCYQEQLLSLARLLASFNLVEADSLRKAAGKKDQKLMSEMGELFIRKAVETGIINQEEAERLFDNMRKSGSYLFNKAHSVAYSINSFRSAHWKVHFPLYFFTSFLYWAKDKQDPLKEIRQLINDAKHYGIEVTTPRFEEARPHFGVDPAGVRISFGLADIRGVGEKAVDKMREAIREAEGTLGPVTTWSWYDFLTRFSTACGKTAVVKMIETGALAGYGEQRQRMLAEHAAYLELTEREQGEILRLDRAIHETPSPEDGLDFNMEDAYAREDAPGSPVVLSPGVKVSSIEDALEALLGRVLGRCKGTKKKPGKLKYAVTGRRREHVESLLKMLRNPPYALVDTPHFVAAKEEANLGIPITCSPVEGADRRSANTTAADFKAGKREPRDGYILGVEVQEFLEREIKHGDNRGRKMATMVLGDDTGIIEDAICFPDAYERWGLLLARPGAVVAIQGKRSYRDPSQLVIDKVFEI